MKKCSLLALCLPALLFLGACGSRRAAEATPEPPPPPPAVTQTPTPEPSPFVFTRENFPRLDGSTATAPMAEAVCSVLLGESREDAADLVSFSKTTESYRNLIGGYADLLLAAEPAPAAVEEKEAEGFRWEMEPFAQEGFVFVVNEDNPVDSLTVEQIQKIYTGEYTNWSQVGGADLEIVPFQRNRGAGSQTLMEKLVMGDLPMAAAPEGYVQGEMGGLMAAVRSFDGSAQAIGYSVYYYASEMEMAGGLKLLAIDGVSPTPETIRSGAYPLRNPYYVVIGADEPVDSPARVLYNWLLSEEGQALADREGYVSVRGSGT